MKFAPPTHTIIALREKSIQTGAEFFVGVRK